MVLGMKRTYGIKPVNCHLVKRDNIFTVRFYSISMGRYKMTNLIMSLNLIKNLQVFIIPFHNSRVNIKGCVNYPVLSIKLSMKRPETKLDLAMKRLFNVKNWNAKWVLACKLLFVNQCLYLLKVKDRGMGIQLTADDYIFAIRADIYAVRALWLRDQE